MGAARKGPNGCQSLPRKGDPDEKVVFGLVGMGSEFVPARGELAHHDFAVDEIFRATEADETDFQDNLTLPFRDQFADERHQFARDAH